jgi:hypothetical protein
VAGHLIATMLAVAQTAASSPDGQGVPLWAAGLFALGGAAITLAVQVFSGHNANRREDLWSCFRSLAEFIAAAHSIIRAISLEGLDAPVAAPLSDTAAPLGSSASRPREAMPAEVEEAFTRAESSYALLVLALPALEEKLAPVRATLARFVDDGPRDAQACSTLKEELDNLARIARPEIRFPVVRIFGLTLRRGM